VGLVGGGGGLVVWVFVGWGGFFCFVVGGGGSWLGYRKGEVRKTNTVDMVLVQSSREGRVKSKGISDRRGN